MAQKKKHESRKVGESKHIKCPFFKRQGEKSICCEGVETGSKIELSFRTQKQRQEYTSEHCAKNYKLCLIAQMNDLKYDDDGNLKK